MATSNDEHKQVFTTLLMDMDGVLAEVSKSYRAAIIQTCRFYGATSITQETITQWKTRGNANDDWKLSYDLIHSHFNEYPNDKKDDDVTLRKVTDTFEEYYQGTDSTDGLYKLETLIPLRETLVELRKRSKPGVGIVTGRPRSDCMKFLKQYDLTDLIDETYCMEDGPSKPDPFPVTRVCELLKVPPSKSVVLIGDTPDDITAAVSAGCSAVGVVTPEAMTPTKSLEDVVAVSPLCIAMHKNGVDTIYEPGFQQLIQRFNSLPLNN